jgi:hypothetical protein
MKKKDTEYRDTLRYLQSQRAASRGPLETPGPHRLQELNPRPQEIELENKIEQQVMAEKELLPEDTQAENPNQHLVDVFKQLAKVMKDTNNSSDTTEPTHFNGSDSKWDKFYSQLRTYLSAKDWLTTFEHPVGPGTPGFNNEINKKLYNKLLMLCKSGHAITYIKKAAEFDGHGAGSYF